MTTNSVGDWITWLLLAMGITFHPHEYLGGLFFALAAAMVTRHWVPETDRREVWLTLGTAALVATFGAQFVFWYWPDVTVAKQLVMAGLGFASRTITVIAMKFVTRIEKRSSDIVDKVTDKLIDRLDK